MLLSGAVDQHYGRGGLRQRIESAVRAIGLDPARLTIDDLAPLEELHTLGRRASIALAERAQLRAGEEVIDVGAGIGGPARLLVERYGCRVTAVDLTDEYCEIARWLNEATGLADRIDVIQGDALALPVDEASFDAAWTQHAQMNIEDKHALYRELRRVLRPGGRLALWEVLAGPRSPIHLPVPWAERDTISFLATPTELRATLEAAGFEARYWRDLTEEAARSFRAPSVNASPLSLGAVVPDLAAKARNMRRNAEEDRIVFLQAVLTAV